MLKIVSLLISSVSSESLRNASKGTGIWIGTAINYKHLNEDQDYADRAALEYNLVTGENACKMNTIAKSFDEFDYTKCNFIVEYAKNSSQQMRAHNLIWAAPGTHNPQFVIDETDQDKLEEFMLDYINKTITAIGDYPFNWDVVNEAVSDGKN